MRRLLAALALGLPVAGSLAGGLEPDPLASNRLGLQRLRSAAALHGSLASDTLRLAVDITCTEYRNPTQARVPDPPFESYSWKRRHHIDRPGRMESVHTRNEFAGFVFEEEIVVRDGESVRLDHTARTREAAHGIPPNVFHLLPQRYIRAGLDNPLSVRWRGAGRSAGRPASQVDIVDAGSAHSLFFDDSTGLLVRVDVLRHADPYGDTIRTYAFEGSQTAAGLTLPRSVAVTTSDAVLGATRNVFMLAPSTQLRGEPSPGPRDGFAEVDYARRPGSSIRTLGTDVYLIENLGDSTEQWSYNVLFAEFEDHVLVAEAPLDEQTTQAIGARIASVVPNKPIRYLVQSHHHDDHLGGIRAYIARGTRLVVTPGNVDLIRRISGAPYSARPDTLARAPRTPVFEVVQSGRLVLSDARLEARIYDVGPTTHASEMLVLHFPAEGILFQSDLVNDGEFPPAERATRLVEKVKELGLEVKVLAGVHGRVLSGAALEKLGL